MKIPVYWHNYVKKNRKLLDDLVTQPAEIVLLCARVSWRPQQSVKMLTISLCKTLIYTLSTQL